MPSISVSETSISKTIDATSPSLGDETFVYVFMGTPPGADQGTQHEYLLVSKNSPTEDDGGAQPHGDFLGGVFVGQDSYVVTSVEPSARTSYFDGKLLSARDLTAEQVSSFDTGFDLM